MGYQPNHLARALATGRSDIVGLWVARPYSPLNAVTLEHIQDIVRPESFDLMIIEADVASDTPPSLTKSHWPVDGIIAIDCAWRVDEYIAKNPRAKTAIVSISYDTSTMVDSVTIDIAAGVKSAMDHLLETGRRRITLITASDSRKSEDLVRSSYTASLEAAGLVPDIIECDTDSRAAGRDACASRLSSGAPLDAILTYTDLLAVGAATSLVENNVAIPSQVALISAAATPELEYKIPPLTVIEQPTKALCDAAWEMLRHRMAHPDAPVQHVTVAPTLIVRGSSAP
jgi:LacI family transcriptional regulator